MIKKKAMLTALGLTLALSVAGPAASTSYAVAEADDSCRTSCRVNGVFVVLAFGLELGGAWVEGCLVGCAYPA